MLRRRRAGLEHEHRDIWRHMCRHYALYSGPFGQEVARRMLGAEWKVGSDEAHPHCLRSSSRPRHGPRSAYAHGRRGRARFSVNREPSNRRLTGAGGAAPDALPRSFTGEASVRVLPAGDGRPPHPGASLVRRTASAGSAQGLRGGGFRRPRWRLRAGEGRVRSRLPRAAGGDRAASPAHDPGALRGPVRARAAARLDPARSPR